MLPTTYDDSAGVSDLPTIKLHSGGPGGNEVATFTKPSSVPEDGELEYTHATGAFLSANTSYWIVATDTDDDYSFKSTSSSASDKGSADGWSVGDRNFNTGWNSGSGQTRFAVKGTPIEALIGNLSKGTSGGYVINTVDAAQKFTTGPNTFGYTLTSVQLGMRNSHNSQTADTPSVKVFSSSARGDEVATLSAAASVVGPNTNTIVWYSVPLSTVLNPNTDYWVVAERASQRGAMTWRQLSQANAGYDGTPAEGWSIDSDPEQRPANNSGAFATPSGDEGFPLAMARQRVGADFGLLGTGAAARRQPRLDGRSHRRRQPGQR